MLVKNKKGFSLFTPLIGTTIIVIAAMLSAMMLQNDVRISRTLSESFEQTNQGNAAKLIKATAEVEVAKTTDEALKDYFSNSLKYTCLSKPECQSIIKSKIKSKIKSDLSSSLYSNVFGEIESITDYSPKDRTCPLPNNPSYMPFENCLSEAVDHGLEVDLQSGTGTSAGKYLISFDIDSDYENAFGVKFSDSQGQSIVVSIKPSSNQYTSSFKAEEIITKAINVYTQLKKVDSSEIYKNRINDAIVPGIKEIEVYGLKTATNPILTNKKKVIITFDKSYYGLDNDLTITFKPNGEIYSKFICGMKNNAISHGIMGLDYCDK